MNKKFSGSREPNLRELIDKKFKEKNGQTYSDLVDNFHWTIQRIRRARRITRGDFANKIGESESTVQMIESGILPEDNYKIISKIENYFGISLRKGNPNMTNTESPKKFILDNSLIEEEEKELTFDPDSLKQLKISDLRKMKEKQEREQVKETSFESWEDEWSEEDFEED